VRERDIERALVERVKALGGEIRKVKWIGRRGAPDRLVMGVPMFVSGHCTLSAWIELKAPGEKPTKQQLREHDRMRFMGQVVAVVDSIDALNEILP
jgi:hypothetical protein